MFAEQDLLLRYYYVDYLFVSYIFHTVRDNIQLAMNNTQRIRWYIIQQ